MGNARQLWLTRVQQWQASGLTADRFAAQHGFKPATLRYWKSFLSRPVPQDPQPTTTPSPSLPLPSTPEHSLPLIELRTSTPSLRDCFELELPSGRRPRIPPSFEPSALRSLLSVLEPQS